MTRNVALLVWLLAAVVGIGFAVSAAVIDVRERRLPNRLVGWCGAAIWGATVVINVVDRALADGAIRLLVAWAVFAGPLLVLWLINPGVIGGGDVKLATVLAPLLSWPTARYAFFALLITAVVALPHATVAARKHSRVPLGPYLIVGATIGGALGVMWSEGAVL